MLWKLAYGAMTLCLAATASVCAFKPSILHGGPSVQQAASTHNHTGSIEVPPSHVPQHKASVPVADPFYSGDLSADTKAAAKHTDAKDTTVRTKNASKRAAAKPGKVVESAMHKDLDRIFSVNPASKRLGWQKDRMEYDRRKVRQQNKNWSGGFPGRS